MILSGSSCSHKFSMILCGFSRRFSIVLVGSQWFLDVLVAS